MYMIINYYKGLITPKPNVIFVFGSNPLGINGNPEKGTGGSALVAHLQFGVEQGEKMNNCLSKSGKAYGLVTVKSPGAKRSLTADELRVNIKKMYDTALSMPDKEFCVAYTNWKEKSLNGYFGYELGYLFYEVAQEHYHEFPSNVLFSEEWYKNLRDSKLQPEINFEV